MGYDTELQYVNCLKVIGIMRSMLDWLVCFVRNKGVDGVHCFDGWKLEAVALTALGLDDKALNSLAWLRDNVKSTSWFDGAVSRWDKARFCKTYGLPWQPGVKIGGNLILYNMHANREVIKVAWEKETSKNRRQQIAYELKKAQSADCKWDSNTLDELAAKEAKGEFVYEASQNI